MATFGDCVEGSGNGLCVGGRHPIDQARRISRLAQQFGFSAKRLRILEDQVLVHPVSRKTDEYRSIEDRYGDAQTSTKWSYWPKRQMNYLILISCKVCGSLMQILFSIHSRQMLIGT